MIVVSNPADCYFWACCTAISDPAACCFWSCCLLFLILLIAVSNPADCCFRTYWLLFLILLIAVFYSDFVVSDPADCCFWSCCLLFLILLLAVSDPADCFFWSCWLLYPRILITLLEDIEDIFPETIQTLFSGSTVRKKYKYHTKSGVAQTATRKIHNANAVHALTLNLITLWSVWKRRS